MSNPDLKELQEIWKSAPSDGPTDRPSISQRKHEVWSRIEAFQKKTRRENILVTICFIATAGILGFFWYWYDWQQMYTTLGILLIIAGMGGSLYFFFQRMMEQRHRDLGQPSRTFIKEAISKLEYQRMIIERVIPIYALMLIGGLNLAYIDILDSLDWTIRLGIHGILTVSLALLFFITRKQRLNKFDQTYGKDLNWLRAMLKKLES